MSGVPPAALWQNGLSKPALCSARSKPFGTTDIRMGTGGVKRQYWYRRSGAYRGKTCLILYGFIFLLYAILRRGILLPRTNPLVLKRTEGLKTVMVIFGTRPEAVKMAPVIQQLAKSAELTSYIVSTGQHKEMLGQVLTEFGLSDKVYENLALMRPGQRLATLSSAAIETIDDVVSRVRPDMVLVQGDTTTAFIAALVSFYEKIPVGHIEAGLRTHDIYSPFPEEINRQSISNIAKLHFAPTELSANNLKAEGKSRMFSLQETQWLMHSTLCYKSPIRKRWLIIAKDFECAQKQMTQR